MGFYQYAFSIGERGGEEVGVAAVFEFELAAKGKGGEGEVAGGEVGARGVVEGDLEGFFVEGGDGIDVEDATWEVGEGLRGGVEVAVGM
jgi:hypothetical protein